MNYSEKLSEYNLLLQDERWRRKREQIIKLDAHKCQNCSSESNLEVHHLGYSQELKPWEYYNENLVTLCHKCHENIESFKHDNIAYEKWYLWLKHKILTTGNGRFISLVISNQYKYT